MSAGHALALLVLALAVSACGPSPSATQLPVDVAELPAEEDFLAELDRSQGSRDLNPVLRDGRCVPAAEAPRMRPEERVIGLDLGSVQIAYPTLLLNIYEIVEHDVAGAQLVVCWCPLCGTGVVHSRKLDGRVLSFGYEGALWHGGGIMYERHTESLFQFASGVAMSGPLRGKRLGRFENTALMTYAAWCREHPDTLVLAKPTDPAIQVDRNAYDERDRGLEFGLALDVPGFRRFYPFPAMKALEAIEDDVGGTPVVVVRDGSATAACVYDRRVGAAVLSFDVTGGERPVLVERGGKRSWYLLSGLPVAGSGASEPLRRLAATPAEWRTWVLQNPGGSVWKRR